MHGGQPINTIDFIIYIPYTAQAIADNTMLNFCSVFMKSKEHWVLTCLCVHHLF